LTRPLTFIASLGFEQRPAAEVAAELAAAGYDGVEWTMAHVDDLRQPSPALACQQDLVTGGASALERTLHAIERAHEAGIGTVNVLTGPNLWEPGARPRDDEQAWATALGSLEAACARAEPLGVAIGFEPCWGTLAHDAQTARRVLDQVPVSVTFDPSHFVMTGDDIPSLVREWGERIVHVHLKDAFGRPGMEDEDFHFCLLGEGHVPWPEFFEALDDAGYDGPLSVEFEAYRYYESVLGGDPVAAARLAAEQVAALRPATAVRS
jgi:sugar phosphate isomerase/epimerase